MRPFEYPRPDLSEQAAIGELIEQHTQIYETLFDAGLQKEAARIALESCAEVKQRASTFAKELGLYRVSAGDMTQVELAEVLDVTPGTICRWVKDAREHAGEEPR